MSKPQSSQRAASLKIAGKDLCLKGPQNLYPWRSSIRSYVLEGTDRLGTPLRTPLPSSIWTLEEERWNMVPQLVSEGLLLRNQTDHHAKTTTSGLVLYN